jgi:general secretion pathway protein K
MSCQRSDLPGPQRGAALIVAMLVFALVAALLVGLQRDFSLTLQRGTQQLFAEQAWAYLLGAEGLAQLALQADNREDALVDAPTDHLGELWAQPATPYPLDAGGEMRGQIEELVA